jgi:hypothetical protein
MRLHRIFPYSLAAALLAACSTEQPSTAPGSPDLRVEEAGHNTADHFKTTEPLSLELESPCNGEAIVFTGEVTTQGTFVDTREHLDNGNSLHSEIQSSFSATGTGAVTGASYTIHDVSHESFDSPSVPAPQFTASFYETFHVTSSVGALSFSFRQLVHVLSTPATGFKVTRDTESATCRG